MFQMKTFASKSSSHYQNNQRLQCPPLLPSSHYRSRHHHHRHRHHHHQQQQQPQKHSKSRTMSFNDTLRVFVNGAWIIWIYLFAIFIRLEYVDAKIGKRPIHIWKIRVLMSMCSFFHSHFSTPNYPKEKKNIVHHGPADLALHKQQPWYPNINIISAMR